MHPWKFWSVGRKFCKCMKRCPFRSWGLGRGHHTGGWASVWRHFYRQEESPGPFHPRSTLAFSISYPQGFHCYEFCVHTFSIFVGIEMKLLKIISVTYPSLSSRAPLTQGPAPAKHPKINPKINPAYPFQREPAGDGPPEALRQV